MRILGVNPAHDGAVVLVRDGALVYSLEAEKDSFPRHSAVGTATLLTALQLADDVPDAIAIGGWHGGMAGTGAGYFGLDSPTVREAHLLGRPVVVVSSSHERSHVFMAAGMAPEAPLDECAVLVWEGQIGAFYHWREGGRVIERMHVLSEPGNRYSALYPIADPQFGGAVPRLEHAGRLMALAAFADGPPSPAEREVADRLLDVERFFPFDKRSFAGTPLYNVGVHEPPVHRAAAYLSDRLFEIFHEAARRWLPTGLPLVISGGCGLNCDWNRRWAVCPIFSSVFVPPCANDSGSAIGTALDAQVVLGGACRLDWRVDVGPDFVHDAEPDDAIWNVGPLDVERLAARLADGAVAAWVQGRAEIGPRALGHRSLLASPLTADSHTRLNEIKRRESYRPIAPSCLSEELGRWFTPAREDPYMLYFANVTTDALPAVTHVDGTARVHSVGPSGPEALRKLLQAFAARTGYGVVCNTSLNYPGLGFINRASDLFRYAEERGIEDVVVADRAYRRVRSP
jgi:hydroxymethyl cephem carbamoyltransferase